MAAEQYTNGASTALTAAYTAGSGTLQVASTGGNFPGSAPFMVMLLKASDSSFIVLLKVTSITDGTHFAVAAEGTDTSASNGDLCIGIILSAASLDRIRGDISRVVTGARPSDGRKGDQLNPTDDLVRWVYNAAFLPFGPAFPFTNPNDQTWAWRNQGGASVTTREGSIYLTAPAASGVNLRCREFSVPATPWTITAAILPQIYVQNFNSAGIYVRDSVGGKITALMIAQGSGVPGLQVVNFTNETTFSASPVGNTTVSISGPIFFQIADDGVNLTFSWSMNGFDFLQLFQVARHSFLAAGPDKLGFFADTEETTFANGVTLISLKVA